MRNTHRIAVMVTALALGGCAPKIGSDKWCEAMGDKPTGEWTANEAADFTKHCVLGIKPES